MHDADKGSPSFKTTLSRADPGNETSASFVRNLGIEETLSFVFSKVIVMVFGEHHVPIGVAMVIPTIFDLLTTLKNYSYNRLGEGWGKAGSGDIKCHRAKK